MEVERKSKVSFVISALVNTLCAAFIYQNYAFRTIFNFSYIVSELVFYAILVLFVAVETVFWLNKPKSFFTQFVNIITPIGIYTVVAYFQDIWLLAICVGVVVVVLNMLLLLVVWPHKPDNNVKKEKISKKTKWKIIRASQNIGAIGFSVIALPIIVSAILFRSVYGPIERYITPWQEILHVSEENIQELKVFVNEDEWKALDQHKKIEALQTMANIYASEKGIPHELIVSLMGFNRITLAAYSDKTCSIAFNISYFNDMSAKEALNALMHECTHAYQCCLVDAFKDVDKKYYNMYIIQKALKYDQEFSNYNNGYIDYDVYYDQWCEADARESAEILTESYLQMIKYYAERE